MSGGNSSYGGYKNLDAAVHEAARIIAKIHSYGMKAGVSIKPRTPVEVVFDLMDKADMIVAGSAVLGGDDVQVKARAFMDVLEVA